MTLSIFLYYFIVSSLIVLLFYCFIQFIFLVILFVISSFIQSILMEEFLFLVFVPYLSCFDTLEVVPYVRIKYNNDDIPHEVAKTDEIREFIWQHHPWQLGKPLILTRHHAGLGLIKNIN